VAAIDGATSMRKLLALGSALAGNLKVTVLSAVSSAMAACFRVSV
jgi:hypothetical protein